MLVPVLTSPHTHSAMPPSTPLRLTTESIASIWIAKGRTSLPTNSRPDGLRETVPLYKGRPLYTLKGCLARELLLSASEEDWREMVETLEAIIQRSNVR